MSVFALKIIAVVSLLIDHTGFFLSCIIFLAIFLLTADAVLAKQDVNA